MLTVVEPVEASTDRRLVNSVLRACRVVDSLADADGEAPLSLIAEAAQLSRPTAYRLLATLESAGWVDKTPSGNYALATRMFIIGSAVGAHGDLSRVATPSLTRLAATTGDTAYLLVPHKDEGLCIQRIEGSYPIRVHQVNPGGTIPLTRGSSSVAMVAFRGDLIDMDALPPTQRAVLERRLQEARDLGYAVQTNDLLDGASGVGAPIFDGTGTVVAAVSVTGTNERFSGAHLQLVVDAVVTAGTEISALLGYRRH